VDALNILKRGIDELASKPAQRVVKQTEIVFARQQNYENLFFDKGIAVLDGTRFPLNLSIFKLEKNISAPKPWKDILSAYGLDTRNFSYPKE